MRCRLCPSVCICECRARAVHRCLEWNPTSSLANALRHQFGNPGGEIPHDAIFPLAHPFEYTLIWAVAIVLVCAPLSVVLYRRSIRT